MAVEILLLGKLEVLRDGRAVSLPPSKKTRALLGYLAATNRSHSRSHLCDMFWEGPDDPRAALRWSLSKIRSIMGEEDAPFLVTDYDRASFDASAADVDLLALRADIGSNPAGALTKILKKGLRRKGRECAFCHRNRSSVDARRRGPPRYDRRPDCRPPWAMAWVD